MYALNNIFTYAHFFLLVHFVKYGSNTFKNYGGMLMVLKKKDLLRYII